MRICVLRDCGSIDVFESTPEEHFIVNNSCGFPSEMKELANLPEIKEWKRKSILKRKKQLGAMHPLNTSKHFNKCRYNNEWHCEFFGKEVDCFGCTEYHT